MSHSRITKEPETWAEYNQKRLQGKPNGGYTESFIKLVILPDDELAASFLFTRRPILQIGSSTAQVFRTIDECAKRRVFAYDSSIIAFEANKKIKVEGRLVDLNELETEKRKLAYEPLLAQDLSSPVDLFFIRILEHLKPQTVILLIMSLIDLAKPGTRFYFEIATLYKRNPATGKDDIHNGIPLRYIASFFAPRTDMRHVSHKISTDNSQIVNGQVRRDLFDHMTLESFIVDKRKKPLGSNLNY